MSEPTIIELPQRAAVRLGDDKVYVAVLSTKRFMPAPGVKDPDKQNEEWGVTSEQRDELVREIKDSKPRAEEGSEPIAIRKGLLMAISLYSAILEGSCDIVVLSPEAVEEDGTIAQAVWANTLHKPILTLGWNRAGDVTATIGGFDDAVMRLALIGISAEFGFKWETEE